MMLVLSNVQLELVQVTLFCIAAVVRLLDCTLHSPEFSDNIYDRKYIHQNGTKRKKIKSLINRLIRFNDVSFFAN